MAARAESGGEGGCLVGASSGLNFPGGFENAGAEWSP
jgi:hypothetical protein